MTIKEIRKSSGLTQAQASAMTGVPLRTYKLYENDVTKVGSIKYCHIENVLKNYALVDETHGILSLDKIKEIVSSVLKNYDVDYCILFGSYAKGSANEKSDVDLLISTNITGLKFYSIVEALRTALKKKVDLLDIKQLNNNAELLNNVLKDGVKIYVQNK